MDEVPWVGIATVLSALLGTGGAGLVVRAIARRRPARVETAVLLNAQTLRYAEQLEQDAAAARQTAREAWTEATAARQMAGEAHQRMEQVVSYLGWIIRTIHDPSMTLERLRSMVGESGPPVSAGSREVKESRNGSGA